LGPFLGQPSAHRVLKHVQKSSVDVFTAPQQVIVEAPLPEGARNISAQGFGCPTLEKAHEIKE
jgi:hypothetical protein